MSKLPEYYFRVKDNGATVFRVETENRLRRLELEPIASLNVRNGQIKAQGDRKLTEADEGAIDSWLKARRETLALREADEMRATVDRINLLTQWAQSQAGEDDLEELTDTLLLAMHDLRSVLVRKKADRLAKAAESGSN